uniref:Uncharacterized protein n=1 Tax=Anguilla anguilla TaxID=7936 RepID=A0A0E9XQ55_ANGAN
MNTFTCDTSLKENFASGVGGLSSRCNFKTNTRSLIHIYIY